MQNNSFNNQRNKRNPNAQLNRGQVRSEHRLPAPSSAPPGQFAQHQVGNHYFVLPNSVLLNSGDGYVMMNPYQVGAQPMPQGKMNGQMPSQYQYMSYGYPSTVMQPMTAHQRAGNTPTVQNKSILPIVNPHTNKPVDLSNVGKKQEVAVPGQARKETNPQPVEKAPTEPANDIKKAFFEMVKLAKEEEEKPNKEMPEAISVTEKEEEIAHSAKAKEVEPDENERNIEETKSEEIKNHAAQKESKPIDKPNPLIVIEMRIKNGKKTYAVEDLQRARKHYKELPEQMKGLDLKRIPTGQPVMKPRGSAFSGKHRGSRGNKFNRQNSSGRDSQVTLSIPVKVQLHKSENAWKPQASKDLNKHEKIISRTQSLLNKLSREKFDKISSQLAAFEFPSLVSYLTYIRLIREKAVKEPNFADMYAELCAIISISLQHKNPLAADAEGFSKAFLFLRMDTEGNSFYWITGNDDIPSEVVKNISNIPKDLCVGRKGPYRTKEDCWSEAEKVLNFKRYLLSLCQKEFIIQNPFADVREKIAEQHEKINKVKNIDEKKYIELQMQLSDMKAKEKAIKRRMMGNIVFIGELFLFNLINKGILSFCLTNLGNIQNDRKAKIIIPSFEKVECLCKLLTTIGKKAEGALKKSIIDIVFKRVLFLSTSEELDNRHRFMCKDLLDLRDKGWKSNKKKTLTKKEVHAEARREEEERQKQVREAQASNRGYHRGKSRWGQQGNMGHGSRDNGFSSGTKSINSNKLGSRPKSSPSSVLAKKSNAVNLMTEEEKEICRKKARSSIKEFISIKDEKELVLDLKDMLGDIPHLQKNKHECVCETFLLSIIAMQVEARLNEQKDIIRAVQVFIVGDYFKQPTIPRAIKKFCGELNEIAVDAPLAPSNFGTLLAEFICLEQISLVDVKPHLGQIGKENAVVAKKVVGALFSRLKENGFSHKEQEFFL